MTLPPWAKWLLLITPLVAAVAILVWYFYFREPSCPKGFTWDAKLSECVPDSNGAPGPGPGPEPGPGPDPAETITFDFTFPNVPCVEAGPNGSNWLVVGFPERGGVFPIVQTVTGVIRTRIETVCEGAVFCEGSLRPKLVLIGVKDDGAEVVLASYDHPDGWTGGEEHDFNIALTPGIRLKMIHIVSRDETTGIGRRLEYFPLTCRRVFPAPIREQGNALVQYGG